MALSLIGGLAIRDTGSGSMGEVRGGGGESRSRKEIISRYHVTIPRTVISRGAYYEIAPRLFPRISELCDSERKDERAPSLSPGKGHVRFSSSLTHDLSSQHGRHGSRNRFLAFDGEDSD